MFAEEKTMSQKMRMFLRLAQVIEATGMSRSWIYEAIKRGAFPAPIQVGLRAVAWDSEAIAEWQAQRMASVNVSCGGRV